MVILPTCKTPSSDQASDDSDVDDAETDDDSPGLSLESDKYPHPRSPDAWETRVLMLTSRLPDAQGLADCEAEVLAFAKDAGNDVRLLQVEEQLRKSVNVNPEMYHWCFYRMAANLDSDLELIGIPIDQKIGRFHVGMRSLWPLSRALDQSRQVDFYFHYLQLRYMDISAHVFGRTLEVVTKPLGDADGPPPLVIQSKEAGFSPNDQ